MKKLYKNYIVQSRKGGRFFILGVDEKHKAIKVAESLNEQDAENKRMNFQNLSNVYYNLLGAFQQQVINTKVKFRQSLIKSIDVDDLIVQVLHDYKFSLIKNKILVKKNIEESILSSR